MRFVIASHNPKKIQEMREILSDLGYEVISPEQAGVDIEVEETGASFEENAILKAQAVMERTGLPAIADDSGLEVRALGGAPGIYSARYGGEGKLDDHGRNALLLQNMADVPDGQRQARFVSAIACVFPGESPLVVRGEVEGEILRAERGGERLRLRPALLRARAGPDHGGDARRAKTPDFSPRPGAAADEREIAGALGAPKGYRLC